MRAQRRIRTVMMGKDKKAGMRALEAPRRGSARYIVDEVLEKIWKVKEIEASHYTGYQGIKRYWTTSRQTGSKTGS